MTTSKVRLRTPSTTDQSLYDLVAEAEQRHPTLERLLYDFYQEGENTRNVMAKHDLWLQSRGGCDEAE